MTTSDSRRFYENEQYLEQLIRFGIKLGLAQSTELFLRSGAPLEKGFIHIAGTNGKGSTGAMLECALRSVGLRTGFYSSPHLIDLRERVRVAGRAVSTELFNRAFATVKEAADAMRAEERTPTFFEFTTALAALIFELEKCDFVVWETGMGGRFDATNVVESELSVITGIALDHQQYLGDTIEKIAFEKAGIIHTGCPVFTGELTPEARFVIENEALRHDAPSYRPDEEPMTDLVHGSDGYGFFQEFTHRGRRIRLALGGAMQRRNFKVVYPVLEHLSQKYDFSLDDALAGLARVRWPGRCQKLANGLVVDGGHNPDGATALAEALAELEPGVKYTVVFAGFKDKDLAGNLRALSVLAEKFIFVPLKDARPSATAAELTEILHRSGLGIPAVAAAGAVEGCETALAEGGRVLAAGSLYLAGEVLARYAPEMALDLV